MRIVVLFNLKPGVDPEVYEAWARGTDIPGVNALSSVSGYTVHKATGLFGSDAASPPDRVSAPAISAGARRSRD